mmetsp:Transcript_14045/g.34778  ORF Transcript_14045/g.34778 Transcript_14045/m.34778 type:complete len:889 (-) Transcript_14045:342-3008(-)
MHGGEESSGLLLIRIYQQEILYQASFSVSMHREGRSSDRRDRSAEAERQQASSEERRPTSSRTPRAAQADHQQVQLHQIQQRRTSSKKRSFVARHFQRSSPRKKPAVRRLNLELGDEVAEDVDIGGVLEQEPEVKGGHAAGELKLPSSPGAANKSSTRMFALAGRVGAGAGPQGAQLYGSDSPLSRRRMVVPLSPSSPKQALGSPSKMSPAKMAACSPLSQPSGGRRRSEPVCGSSPRSKAQQQGAQGAASGHPAAQTNQLQQRLERESRIETWLRRDFGGLPVILRGRDPARNHSSGAVGTSGGDHGHGHHHFSDRDHSPHSCGSSVCSGSRSKASSKSRPAAGAAGAQAWNEARILKNLRALVEHQQEWRRRQPPPGTGALKASSRSKSPKGERHDAAGREQKAAGRGGAVASAKGKGSKFEVTLQQADEHSPRDRSTTPAERESDLGLKPGGVLSTSRKEKEQSMANTTTTPASAERRPRPTHLLLSTSPTGTVFGRQQRARRGPARTNFGTGGAPSPLAASASPTSSSAPMFLSAGVSPLNSSVSSTGGNFFDLDSSSSSPGGGMAGARGATTPVNGGASGAGVPGTMPSSTTSSSSSRNHNAAANASKDPATQFHGSFAGFTTTTRSNDHLEHLVHMFDSDKILEDNCAHLGSNDVFLREVARVLREESGDGRSPSSRGGSQAQVDVLYLEKVRDFWLKLDEKNKGAIEYEDFHRLMYELTKGKMKYDLPEARLKAMWSSMAASPFAGADHGVVTRDSATTGVSFEQFILWWLRNAEHDLFLWLDSVASVRAGGSYRARRKNSILHYKASVAGAEEFGIDSGMPSHRELNSGLQKYIEMTSRSRTGGGSGTGSTSQLAAASTGQLSLSTGASAPVSGHFGALY